MLPATRICQETERGAGIVEAHQIEHRHQIDALKLNQVLHDQILGELVKKHHDKG